MKATGHGAQPGKNQVKHRKKFPWTGYEDNQANLRCGQLFHHPSSISKLTLTIKVRKEYAILKDYQQDWPTRDMLKLHLKYTSEATRRSMSVSAAKKIEKVR
jgi:hypothetical protein